MYVIYVVSLENCRLMPGTQQIAGSLSPASTLELTILLPSYGTFQIFQMSTVVTSALSLIVESVSQHPSILISGVLGMLLSPYAAFQQRKISEVEALHQTNVLLEQELTHIKEENAKLSVQVQEVQTTVARLDSLEATMEAISALEGASLDKLQEQLDESKEILTHMHRNYQADILQNLVSVLLATDADQNMLLADEEIDDLIRNLEGIHGVQLKEDLLRKVIIEQGRSVDALMEVARNVISPPEQSGTVKPIFTYLE
jgi:hypothetical protein